MVLLCNTQDGCGFMVDGLKIEERGIRNNSILSVLKQIDQHQQEITKCLASMESKIDGITKAFPDGDFDGHRQYHAAMMETLAERKRLRLAIQEKTISGLVWAGLVALGFAVFHEIQTVLLKR